MHDSQLVNNSATRDGAAISVSGFAQLNANRTRFAGNAAGRSGGACSLSTNKAFVSALKDCTIENNTAVSGNGGAISAYDAGLLVESTEFTDNRAILGHGGSMASVGQQETTTVTTFATTACTHVELNIDWLTSAGSCAMEFDWSNYDASCEKVISHSGHPQASCEEIVRDGFYCTSCDVPVYIPTNCSGCPCNMGDSPETYTTIKHRSEATAPGRDSENKSMILLARPRTLVRETFCLADGQYTFNAVDKMTIPHPRPWWGGKYRVIVSGDILAESTLTSKNVTLDFDIVNGTAEAVVTFMRNEALRGGGGGVYWDVAQPTNIEEHVRFVNNEALYGPDVATAASALSPRLTKSANSTIEIPSGTRMSKPIAVELVDRYAQIVLSDSVSTMFAEVSSANGNVTLSGPRAFVKHGLAEFEDLIINAAPGSSTALTFSVPDGDATVTVEVNLRICVAGEIDEGMKCAKCPAGDFWRSAADHDAECVRLARGFEFTSDGTTLEQLSLLGGFWRADSFSEVALACMHHWTCRGGNNTLTQCREGHGGPLCAGEQRSEGEGNAYPCLRITLAQSLTPPPSRTTVCENGWVASMNGICTECTAARRRRQWNGLYVVMSLALFIAVVGVLFRAPIAKYLEFMKMTKRALTEDDTTQGRIVMALVLLQILGLMSTSMPEVKLPSICSRLSGLAAVLSINVSFTISSSCLVNYNLFSQLKAMTAVPICIALALITAMRLVEYPASRSSKLGHTQDTTDEPTPQDGPSGESMTQLPHMNDGHGEPRGPSSRDELNGRISSRPNIKIIIEDESGNAAEVSAPPEPVQAITKDEPGDVAELEASGQPQETSEGHETLANKLFKALLILTYLVYPSVSIVIFQTFACRSDFDYGEEYLWADMSLSCNSNTYRIHRMCKSI